MVSFALLLKPAVWVRFATTGVGWVRPGFHLIWWTLGKLMVGDDQAPDVLATQGPWPPV